MCNNQTNEFKSWTDVYDFFMATADEIWDQNEDKMLAVQNIGETIEKVYLPHQGEDIWDLAYERWIEPGDDDEEV